VIYHYNRNYDFLPTSFKPYTIRMILGYIQLWERSIDSQFERQILYFLLGWC